MKYLLALLLLCSAPAFSQQLVNCAPATPCTTVSGPSGTGTGDPAWLSFGKLNANDISTAATIASLLNQRDFNVLDYGALCDGVHDDTDNFNQAFAAARASLTYTTDYMQVSVSGPIDKVHRGCVIGASGTTFGINATGFTVAGNLANGLSPGHLIIQNMNILCSDPTPNNLICLDTSGSQIVTLSNVQIYGNQASPPFIGLQQANVAAFTTGCCGHTVNDTLIDGWFQWLCLYNNGSESTTYNQMTCGNGNTTRGTINNFAVTTAGTGYNGGGTATFTKVPLTKVACAIKCINVTANITVTSGAVSKVTIFDGGQLVTANDTFTASAASLGNNGGSGFLLTVSSIANFAAIFDGQTHFNLASHWTTVTNTPDTQISFTQVNINNSSFRSNVAAIGLIATTGINFNRVYPNTESSTLALPCVYLYDVGVAPNSSLHWEGRCETNKSGGVGDFFITGTNVGPTLASYRLNIDYEKGNATLAPAVFNIDPNLAVGTAGIALSNADISLGFVNRVSLFADRTKFQMSGNIKSWRPDDVNLPQQWGGGQICFGEFSTTAPVGLCRQDYIYPVDNVVPTGGANLVAWAGSCARVLLATYDVGKPLCQIQRASDSGNMDVYPTGDKTADKGAMAAFCAGTTCKVGIVYDQSSHANNGVQATAANMPVLNLSNALLNGRTTMTWTSASAVAMAVTAAAGVNDVFATNGGGASVVVSRAATGASLGRLLYKSDGATVGWDIRTNGTANPKIEFLQQASTSALDYITVPSISASLPYLFSVQFANASAANVPIVNMVGTSATFSTNTAYVGTVSSDAAQNLIIGNTVATGGTNSFAGDIAEIILFSPTTALNVVQMAALSANQAAFYNQTFPLVH